MDHRRIRGTVLLKAGLLLLLSLAARPARALMCPQEAGALPLSGRTKCGPQCQQETRAALMAISDTLLAPSGLDWSNDSESDAGPVNFTTANCNAPAAGGGKACTVKESFDLLPGNPDTFVRTVGGGDGDRLPSYCCWRGVVCCTLPDVVTMHTRCEPYVVIGLLLSRWPEDLYGNLSSIMQPLLTLDKWGLQRLDISGHWLNSSFPTQMVRMTNLFDLMLGDNSEWWRLGGRAGRERGVGLEAGATAEVSQWRRLGCWLQWG